jgi:hypothetical protein
MNLSLATQDERAGLPSASEYDRLLACRASHLLSRRAHALGQVAHQWSPAADLGTKKHLASVEGPQALSEAEREDWEKCQGIRAALLDFKFGAYCVADPADNLQLSIYALLVAKTPTRL